MAETPPDDLRTLADATAREVADRAALDARDEEPELIHPPYEVRRRIVGAVQTAVTDAVLAAVLPAHRRQVLDEAAQVLQPAIDWQRATYGNRPHTPQIGRVIGMQDAQDAIRRLAETGPQPPAIRPVPAREDTAVPQETAEPSGDAERDFGPCPHVDALADIRTEWAEAISDRAALRRRVAELEARAECDHDLEAFDRQRERLNLAKGALVRTGYFTEDEVSDDIAPRITELNSALTAERDEALQRGFEYAGLAGDRLREVEKLRRQYAAQVEATEAAAWRLAEVRSQLACAKGTARALRGEQATPAAEHGEVLAERDRLADTVRRVREIHVEYDGRCTACVEYCDCLDRVREPGDDVEVAATARMCPHGNVPWPCPTVAALDAADASGEQP